MTKSQQLTFDWGAPPRPAAPEGPVTSSGPLEQATLPKASYAEATASTGPSIAPRCPRRGPARLPVPHPLPAAVGKGNFGEDEHGPVRPSLDEVRAISDHHAEKLIVLLDELNTTHETLRAMTRGDRPALVREKDRLLSAYQSGIALYAEDFGQAAANRLDAYVKYQVRIREES